MVVARIIAVGVAGALVAAGFVIAPAIGAAESAQMVRKSVGTPRIAGGFTPSAADPRLAAMFARGGLGAGEFRFTPSEVRRDNRAVTVAVRARSNRNDAIRGSTAFVSAPTVGLAPIAYNLGVSVGLKRFAISGDVSKVDMAGQPGSREAADLAVSYRVNRFLGQVKAGTDRALPGTSRLIDNDRSYSLDLGGSYSLTRNLDVTAGVRYRSDRERLVRSDDERQDSQAVYVGTAFRF